MLPSLAVLAPALALAAASGGPAERPHLRAVRTASPPEIDGLLDESVWQQEAGSSTFVQRFPQEGAAPVEPTTVRVLYDAEALYIGIECVQRQSPVVAKLTRRDRSVEADRVTVDIDSRADRVSAFHFEVNAAGVLSDGIYYNDTSYSSDWDENWDARTDVNEGGWTAELRIPLRVLRFDPARGKPWGLQVRRFVTARQETDEWVLMPRAGAGFVSRFGFLEGLDGLAPAHRLELMPFVLGRLRHRDAGAVSDTLAHGWDLKGSAGLDARLHLTPELTMDLSLLPDFGQVEADQVVMNLSKFEVYYPEKRRFFLGMDIFSTPLTVLYTRRIGRGPPAPALAAGEQLVDASEPSPIYSAVKLIGRLGERTSLGIISAVTGRNDVQVNPSGGIGPNRSRLAEPLSTFNLLRIRRDLGGNGSLGVIAAATNRFEPSGATAPCAAGTAVTPLGGRCWSDAYVAGVDARWRSRDGSYSATGQVVGSVLAKGPDRSQPDGHSIRPGHPAAGATAVVGKDGGRNWLAHLQGSYSGRELELNDLGYLSRKGDWATGGDVAYRTLDPWWRTLESSVTLVARYQQNLDGVRLWNAYQLQLWSRFSNFSSAYLAFGLRQSYFDDREIGNGTALQHRGRWGVMGSWNSDPRQRVVLAFWAQFWGFSGGYYGDAWGQLLVRPLPRLEIDVQPSVVFTDGEPRYVASPAPGQLEFGQLRAQSAGITLRATYTFTPRLTLQTYAQPFVSNNHYHDFSTFAPARLGPGSTVPLGRLAADPGYRGDHDGKQATLNLNVVLRWEYHLGSTLFVVYSRSQSPAVSTQPAGLDLRPLLRAHPAIDVLMLKLSYWWG